VTTITLPAGFAPSFVHTTQNDLVYVAEANASDSALAGQVSVVSVSGNVVSRTIAVGGNPVALAETPDTRKLYAVNQASGTVTSINTIDGSINAAISTGTSPVWAVARSDSQRLYVLNRDDGTVSTIDTNTDQVLGSPSVGAGADFMTLDRTHNRLYVTNPLANTLSVLDTTADPAAVVMTIPVPASPMSVAALPDGSRVYVASEVTGGSTISPQVTVLNAGDGTVRTTIPLTASAASCDPAARFRLFAVAANDSSRVYVGNCDAGSTAVIRTTPNTTPDNNQSADQLVLDIKAPVSSLPPAEQGGTPPPQNPVFILAGP
ncbi:MAG TPA: YncE family protein, partial [Terriglobales bacterium]|jgi:YVTN family beta-propeller protein